ncbi:MAG: CDP-alcohol phosphatidyltransferase family protein [Nanoarchaeota archaeon]
MAKHAKMKVVGKTREALDKIFLKLPLPKINPNTISAASIITSLLFVFSLNYSALLAFVLILITLLFDWLDGLVAKKHRLASEEGYMVDVTADRMSEGIMFLPFFMPWFLFFAVNNVLALWGFKKNKHIIMPLRHLFLVYFLLVFVF